MSPTNVSLRPWPVPKNEDLEPTDIAQLLFQLGEEKGHFRNVTEERLQAEIDSAQDVSETASQAEDGDVDEEQARKDKLKEIHETSEKMKLQLDTALFWARAGLDMVTLALSKNNPQLAAKTLSKPIKELNIPTSSFGISKEHAYPVDESEDRKRALLAQGSRVKALESSTDSILKAAQRLETEVRKETKYWDEILSISEKGWAIRRFGTNVRHSPLAVRYGYSEVSDHFRGREVAPLRMDATGGIMLDPALTQQPKAIRVRVSVNGKIVGTSKLAPLDEGSNPPIEKLIQLARDSLFEEELFHEVSLETRHLLSHGVELKNSVIHLPAPRHGRVGKDRVILIDRVNRDETGSEDDKHSQDALARNVAESLRLLLAHEHRMRLHRRSRIPTPLSQAKRVTQHTPFLRTILSCFHHMKAVDALKAHLKRLSRTMRRAGLKAPIRLDYETSLSNLVKTIIDPSRKDFSAMDRLLEVFTRPLDSVAKLKLPSSKKGSVEQVRIETRTYLAHPIYGSEYKVTIPASTASVLMLPEGHRREFKFTEVSDMTSYLDWMLSLDISHSLVSKEYPRYVPVNMQPQCCFLVFNKERPVQKDISTIFSNGTLKVTMKGTDPPIEKEIVWKGKKGQEKFRATIKSFVDAK